MAFTPQDFINGQVLLVNKPINWTSFDVVNKLRFNLRRFTGQKKIKVGHAGTLDPLATGLLLICTGKFTKKINEYQGLPKSYRATIKLGEETPSYDAETEVSKTWDISQLSVDQVKQAMQHFVGDVKQFPPVFSAVKKDGIRSYQLAREGVDVKLDAREITISEFELVESKWPEIVADVQCSKGTYIRSLAHDLGRELGVGSYLTGLVRTKVGDFELKDAIELDDLIKELRAE